MNDTGISPVPREARRYQGRPAGLVTRALAAAIDTLVVCGVLLLCYLGVNGARFLVNPRSFTFSDTSFFLSVIAGLVVLVVYLTAAWAITGRSYGCHVLGLRVLGSAGRRPGPVQSFVRAVLYAVFPIGLLWCAGSRGHRSLQDLVVRTSVVYDWTPRAAEPPPPG